MTDENTRSYESPAAVAAFNTEGYRTHEKKLFDTYFRSGTVLDLGCGTGRSTKLLHSRGLQVTGADISPRMVEQARRNYPDINFLVADAMALPFPDGQFESVFFSDNGLDYLYPESSRIRSLRDIKRVLDKNGTFAFSSHRARFPKNSYRLYHFIRSALLGQIHPYRYEFTHYGRLLAYHVSPRKQRRQLEDSGFTVLEIMDPKSSSPMYIARNI